METKEIIKLVIEVLSLMLGLGTAVVKIISSLRAEFKELHVLIEAQNVKQEVQSVKFDQLKEQLTAHREEFGRHVEDDHRQFGEISQRLQWFTAKLEGFLTGRRVTDDERSDSREMIG